jgi:hypothetical protein
MSGRSAGLATLLMGSVTPADIAAFRATRDQK